MENRTQEKEITLPAEFQSLFDDMIAGLNLLRLTSIDPVITIAKKCIQYIRLSIERLKEQVAVKPFDNREAEIIFFKQVKPVFHCHLVFWTSVFNIELLQPIGGRDVTENYLKKELDKLNSFFASNASFYTYCRYGETRMDEIYFLREKMDEFTGNPHSVDSDRSFSTSHDYLVAQILANEMLQEYLTREIVNVAENAAARTVNQPHTALKWTAAKAGMVELIYALQSAGVYNNGNVEIKELATYFEALFHVDLGNYYHTFNEIRLRKKNRTQLVDQLKEKLVKKMDEMDER